MNEKEYLITFSTNLDYFLRSNHITQTELAERLNITKQSVNYWVHGKKLPRMDKIEQIANILGIQKSDLLDNIKPHYELDRKEQELIYYFRHITEKSQEKVLEYAEMLSNK